MKKQSLLRSRRRDGVRSKAHKEVGETDERSADWLATVKQVHTKSDGGIFWLIFTP